jgi:uncharacterized protein
MMLRVTKDKVSMPPSSLSSSTIGDLLGSPQPFLNGVIEAANEHGVSISKLECDHICYRVAKLGRYELLRDQIATECGTLVWESMVAGRPIAIFKLHNPVPFLGGQITCLELPAHKRGSDYENGWEHVEFVTGEPLKNFMLRYPKTAFGTKAISKAHSAEIDILGAKGPRIKFHERGILDVIAAEQAAIGSKK